jgi:CheY-like chemotaxis protein
MRQSSLLGRSILLIESEPFIACCLEMILQAAGADVRRAATSREGLSLSDQPELSAAVLDINDGLRDCDLGIARRLTERRLPFLLYGGHAGGRCEALPDAPLVSKWSSGGEIVEMLCALIVPRPSEPLVGVASALGAPEAAQPHATRAMAHIESLMKRRGPRRARYRSSAGE